MIAGQLLQILFAITIAQVPLSTTPLSPLDDQWREYAGDYTPEELSGPPIYYENTLRRPGDANNDGQLDFFDIDHFVEALVADTDNWQMYWYLRHLGGNPLNLDLNWDGTLNFFDVDAFVLIVVNPDAYWDEYSDEYADHINYNLSIDFVNDTDADIAVAYKESTMQ